MGTNLEKIIFNATRYESERKTDEIQEGSKWMLYKLLIELMICSI